MNLRTPRALLFLGLVAGLAACGDSRLPTVPTATPATPVAAVPVPAPAPVIGGELIKGAVYDTALRRLAGARVEFLSGPQTGVSTTTDALGHFDLFGIVDDTTRFRASKEGHLLAEATVQPACARCNPSRWVYFYLNVLEPPVALAGDYTLTFVADPSCINLPSELRTRRYEATITPGDFTWVGFPAHAPTSFKVTPTGSAFPDGLNYFWLNVAGHDVAIVLGDHTDPGVTERVDDSTYFAFMGSATVSVASPVSTIATTFQGWIDRCVDPNMGQRYDCTLGPARRTRCESAGHQLILSRR